MSKTLLAVCGTDRFRARQDGGLIKLLNIILAQVRKAVAFPEAFHRLTPDEQDAFYVFLFCC
jgi:hypothetical protein